MNNFCHLKQAQWLTWANLPIYVIYQGWPIRGSRASCGSLPGFMRLWRIILWARSPTK